MLMTPFLLLFKLISGSFHVVCFFMNEGSCSPVPVLVTLIKRNLRRPPCVIAGVFLDLSWTYTQPRTVTDACRKSPHMRREVDSEMAYR